MASNPSIYSLFITAAYSDAVCVLCKPAKDLIKMRSDGRKTLLRNSIERGDDALTQYLSTEPTVVNVHKSCQLLNNRELKVVKRPAEPDESASKRLLSGKDKFDYNLCCFLCCQPVTERYRAVKSKDKLHKSMLHAAVKRHDEWSFEVLGRLHTSGDVRAVDANYHVKCHLYFKSGRNKPSAIAYTARPIGRPVNTEMQYSFETVCEWMKSGDGELFTIGQLHDKMIEIADDCESVYSVGYLKSYLPQPVTIITQSAVDCICR